MLSIIKKDVASIRESFICRNIEVLGTYTLKCYVLICSPHLKRDVVELEECSEWLNHNDQADEAAVLE